jgi:DNA modification methylase
MNPLGRKKAHSLDIATKPFKEAHFATFPPELPEICIKAGCPEGGTVLDPLLVLAPHYMWPNNWGGIVSALN